eukprot:TRINITY_DN8452_c0_g2_i2.p1 TRINITY_DN8452_c0_g2~~TRINITY_DN8452_c0_g2_i2.p1  ORF type:complete len:507 (+),score=59.14 TRINITY_DN8452_c0_g2_i2:1405-2925(+)
MMSAYVFATQRALAVDHPTILQQQFCLERRAALRLSHTRLLHCPHQHGAFALSLDYTQGRYLLTGGHDANICLFDTEDVPVWQLGKEDPHVITHTISTDMAYAEMRQAGGRHLPRHRAVVSAVQWYPHDNGMFVSAGMDGLVIVWDAHVFEPVMVYGGDREGLILQREGQQMLRHVYAAEMSEIGTTQSLVACGTNEAVIRLFDLRTLASAQTLVGHRQEVRAVSWSPENEYHVCSGGADGQVRVWDVRRAAACLLSLDQNDAEGYIVQTSGAKKRPRPRDLDSLDKHGARGTTAARGAAGSGVAGWAQALTHAANSDPTSAAQQRFMLSNKRGAYELSAAHKPAKGSGLQAVLTRAHTVDHRAHDSTVTDVLYTQDGRHIVSCGRDKRIRMWDSSTGANTLVNFPKTTASKRGRLAVSHTGECLYASKGNDVVIYSLTTGEELSRLRAHHNTISALAPSRGIPHGTGMTSVLFSASIDGRMMIWEHEYTRDRHHGVRDDEDNWSD